MNVTLPDNKLDKKSKIVYASIIAICIISIIIVIYIQFFDGKTVTTVGYLKGKSEIDYENLKAEFNNIYTNSLKNYNDKYDKLKSDTSKELVYTGYTKDVTENNSYNINVQIPYINIKNTVIEGFNQDIKDTFEQKAKSILSTQSQNIIYNVEYCAYVTNDILSLVVRSTLKEGENTQREIIQTYNYNLLTQKKVTFEDLLNLKNISRQDAGNKIRSEIKSVESKVNELAQLGYQVYPRNSSSDIYKLDNISEYFIGEDNVIYVIFAYGNKSNTNEKDIIIM